MSNLRDFLYLDHAKLHSFVSQVHGGMISEVNETTKQQGGLSAGINIGVPQLGGRVDAAKQKESERQQNITMTNPAYFGALHEYLEKEKSLIDITGQSLEEVSVLPSGQFIEVQGVVEPPLVENWIERINSVFEFLESNSRVISKLQGGPKGKSSPNISNMQLRQYKSVIDLLIGYINLTRKDPGKQYVRISIEDRYRIWCGLLPSYSMVPLRSALPAEARILGRVEHFVKEGKVEKIVDLSMFNQATQVDQLLKVFSELNVMFGQEPISETDLEAKYPDVFIAPVAIYQ